MPNLKWTQGFHFDQISKPMRDADPDTAPARKRAGSNENGTIDTSGQLEKTIHTKIAVFQSRFRADDQRASKKQPSLLALGLQIQELTNQFSKEAKPSQGTYPPQLLPKTSDSTPEETKKKPAIPPKRVVPRLPPRASSAPQTSETSAVLARGLATLSADPSGTDALRKLITKSPPGTKNQAARLLVTVSQLPDFGFFPDMLRNHPAQARILFQRAAGLFLMEESGADKLHVAAHFALARLSPSEAAIFICELCKTKEPNISSILAGAIGSLEARTQSNLAKSLKTTCRLPHYRKIQTNLAPIFEICALTGAQGSGGSATVSTRKNPLTDRAFLNLSLIHRMGLRSGILGGQLSPNVLAEIMGLSETAQPHADALWPPVVDIFQQLCSSAPLSALEFECLTRYATILIKSPLKEPLLEALTKTLVLGAATKNAANYHQSLTAMAADSASQFFQHIKVSLETFTADETARIALFFPAILNICLESHKNPVCRSLGRLIDTYPLSDISASRCLEILISAPKRFPSVWAAVSPQQKNMLLVNISSLLPQHPSMRSAGISFAKCLSPHLLEEFASSQTAAFKKIIYQSPLLLRPFANLPAVSEAIEEALQTDPALFTSMCKNEAWYLLTEKPK